MQNGVSEYKLISQVLYRNTLYKQSLLHTSGLSICIEELKSVIGDRDKMPSTDDLSKAIMFIERCGFEYVDMYLMEKRQDSVDTIYRFGYVSKSEIFDISVENEKIGDSVVSHVGIVCDM